MRILFIGDIVGESGLEYLKALLPGLRTEHRINLVVVNAENITNGRGINKRDYKELMKSNISAITLGNHVFSNEESIEILPSGNMIRPLNIKSEIGKGFITINYNGSKVTIVSLLGTIFMNPPLEINNPFIAFESFLANHTGEYLVVDFHSNATSEKLAFAHYFDGKCDAILGTHTHVQTADERLLPKGTLYITDVGMTGPKDGIIGMDKDIIIDRFMHDDKRPFKLAKGPKQLSGVVLDLVNKSIKRVYISE